MDQTVQQYASTFRAAAITALVLMTICVIVIGVGKTSRAREMKAASLRFLGAVQKAFLNSHFDAAMDICKSHKQSHLAHVVLAGLIERKSGELRRVSEGALSLSVREAMDRNVATQALAWKEQLGLIDAIGRTAPFVGVIAGSPAGIAAGTLLSLLTIWLGVYLRDRSDALEVELKSIASEMRQILASPV